MNNQIDHRLAFKHFLLHFKNQKTLLFITFLTVVLSVIFSIIIPLKTANIIDSIVNNISTKNTNSKTLKKVKKFIPLINDIEKINFEALEIVLKDPQIKDLVEYDIISKKSIRMLDKDVKELILNSKADQYKGINCYECKKTEDFTKPINDIYKLINLDKNLTLKELNYQDIYKDFITIIILVILIFLINYLSNITMCKINKKVITKIRNQINQKIYNLPLNKYNEGDILSIITNDIENISNTISTEIIDIINSITLLISLIIIMFTLSIKLTLTILAIIPFIFILLIISLIKSSKYFKSYQDNLATYNDFILNSYHGYKDIRSYNQKENFITKEENINRKLYNSSWKSNFYGSLMQPIVQFASNLNFLVLCIFGSILVLNGSITIGMLQAFITYAKNFSNPLIGIASTISIIEQTLVSNERIYNFLNIKEECNTKKVTNINFNQDITFKNVSFGYNDNKVLKNINLTIKQGDKVAIVGETGSGKTTLINLLLNLYKIDEGDILVGNTSIYDIDKKTLRDNIGVITQDSWLFKGTIAENISYGTTYNKKIIKSASKKAQLDQIINKLPNKYDYEITYENALSKGERQLISIARVFMHDKSIIILDEATSNVDLETEKYIQESIENLMQNKTCLIIAHRLSTIMNADKIIVMEKGNITETGTHKELLKKKGYYYNIFKSQFE